VLLHVVVVARAVEDGKEERLGPKDDVLHNELAVVDLLLLLTRALQQQQQEQRNMCMREVSTYAYAGNPSPSRTYATNAYNLTGKLNVHLTAQLYQAQCAPKNSHSSSWGSSSAYLQVEHHVGVWVCRVPHAGLHA
jgi:hypothetical protein